MITKLGIILADYATQLSTDLSAGMTTATLQNAFDDDGNVIPAGYYFFTLDDKNAQKEYILALVTIAGSGASSVANLSGITNVSRQGVVAGSAGAVRLHRVGASVTVTDFASLAFLNNFFTGGALIPSATPLAYDAAFSPVLGSFQVPTWDYVKAYIDGAVVGGGVDATSTTKGIGRFAQPHFLPLGTATISIANPAVVTIANTLIAGDTIRLTTTGTLPAPLLANANYYVLASGLSTASFQISNTQGGTAISTVGGTQSGVHTLKRTTPVFVGDNDSRMLTQGQKDAAVGNDGTPSSTNPFLTRQSLNNILQRGGSGADGALAITAGVTTIDLANSAYVVKNYTSISITGTASIAFINPASTGTTVVFLSQGNVTISSSANPTIDLRGMGSAGGAGGAAGTSGNGSTGSAGQPTQASIIDGNNHQALAGTFGGTTTAGTPSVGSGGLGMTAWGISSWAYLNFPPGAGGGGGGGGGKGSQNSAGAGGAGGAGGGSFLLVCSGILNLTSASTINVSGSNGTGGGATGSTSFNFNNAGSGGGGGGGGAGSIRIITYGVISASNINFVTSGGTAGAAGTFNNGITGGTASGDNGGGGGGGGGGGTAKNTGANGSNASAATTTNGSAGGAGGAGSSGYSEIVTTA